MRRTAQLLLIALALLLTVANSAAPPVRHMTQVGATSGDIALTLDARAYADRPFMVVMPGIAYRSVTLTRLAEEGHADSNDEVVLTIAGDDPRLQGRPVRLRLLPPAHHSIRNARFRLVAIAEDGREGRAEFAFREVWR